MTNADQLQLQSHRFFAEERLTASVLNQSADAERQRRWLHNRLLHGYGISFGLEVTRSSGDTSVTVRKGHAIDSNGRDLVIDRPAMCKCRPRRAECSTSSANGPNGGRRQPARAARPAKPFDSRSR